MGSSTIYEIVYLLNSFFILSVLIDPLTDNYIIGNNYHLDYIGNCKIFDFNQLFEADKEII